jgi:hypothetical protein
MIYASAAKRCVIADNIIDRESLQGYITTLFGDPIVRRTSGILVTTSSTEAELLALSQEGIFIGRPFKAMALKLNEPVIIDCDTTQTLQLVRQDAAKLISKI